MALETVTKDIIFNGAADDSVNPLVLPEGMVSFSGSSNIYHDRLGRIAKRPGFTTDGTSILPSGTLGSSPRFLGGYKNQALREDSHSLYVKNDYNGTNKFVSAGRLPCVQATMTSVGTGDINVNKGGWATARANVNSTYGYLWCICVRFYDYTSASYKVRVGVWDERTKAWASVPQVLNTTLLGVISLDDRFAIVSQSGADIVMHHVTFADPTTVTSTATLIVGATANAFDMAAKVNSSGFSTGSFAIVYEAGGAALVYREFDHSGTAAFAAVTVDATNAGATRVVSCCYKRNTNRFFIAWFDINVGGGGLYKVMCRAYDGNTAVAASSAVTGDLAPAHVTEMGLVYNETNNQCALFYGIQDITNTWYNLANYTQYATVDSTGAAGANATIAQGVSPCSRPFVLSGTPYVVVRYMENTAPYTQTSAFVVNSSGKVMSRLLANDCGWLRRRYEAGVYGGVETMPQNFQVSGESSQVAYVLVPQRTGATSQSGAAYECNMQMTRIDFNYQNPKAVPVAGGMLFACGDLRFYDGARVVEHGFHIYPNEITDAAPSAGGSLAAATYSYVGLFAWTDAQGRVHRSTPSSPGTFTIIGASGNYTVVIATVGLGLTDKPTNDCRFEVYRTIGGSTGNYYFAGSASLGWSAAGATVTLSAADASISSNATLYTTGGVLENAALAAPVDLVAKGDQIFVQTCDNPNGVWVSKPLQDATALELSDDTAMQINIPGLSDPITGLVSLGNALTFLTRNTGFVVTGDGPNALGQGLFSLPQQLPGITDGCIERRSIALIPGGFAYQGTRGMWRLALDGSVTELPGLFTVNSSTQTGEDGTLIFVYGAVYWRTTQLLVCSVYNAGTNETWCLDLKAGGWFKWTCAGYALACVPTTTAAADYETFYIGAGTLSPAVFNDDGVAFTWALVTGVIHVGALQGFQRVKEIGILGYSTQSSTLTVGLYLDSDQGTLTDTVAISLGDIEYIKYRWKPQYQKTGAFQVSLAGSSGTGQGPYLTGLSLSIAGKVGIAKAWTQK